jgi:AcrR family transcriptional regulator
MSPTADAPTPAQQERTRNPRGRGEQLRNEILAAVAALLDERIAEPDLNLSLREVARATGIATQSMYLHFPDKNALAWAVAADGFSRLLGAMQAADQAVSGGAADRLRAQAHAFVEFAESNRGVFRLMFGQDTSRFDAPHHRHPGADLWPQWLLATKAVEAEGGQWPHGPEIAAQHLWSALLGRFSLWSTTFASDTTTSLTEYANYLVDELVAQATTAKDTP